MGTLSGLSIALISLSRLAIARDFYGSSIAVIIHSLDRYSLL